MHKFKSLNTNKSKTGYFIVDINFLFILGVIVICFAISCKYSNEQKYQKLVTNAIKYNNNKKFNNSIDELNEAIGINPQSAIGYLIRGKTYNLLEKHYYALNDFSTVLILKPANTAAFFEKGYTYYLLHQYDSAIFFFNRAINSKGSDSVYFESNDILYKDGLIQEDVHMPEIRFFRGLTFYNKKMDSLALSDLYFSESNNFDMSRTDYYIGIILLSHNFKDKGCHFLKIADSLGNKRAEFYLSNYCK